MPVQKYHISIRILHWLMALIILSLLAVGFYMAGLDPLHPLKSKLYIMHKSFGVIIFTLVFIRIFSRILTKAPPLPNSISATVRILASLVQYLLYLFMILMPVSGYLMSNYYGFKVIFFFIPLPNIVSTNPDLGKIFNNIHDFSGYGLIILLALHIAGALKHHFFDIKENDVLKRML